MSCIGFQDFFDRGPVQSPAAPSAGQDVFNLLGDFNGPSSAQDFPQGAQTSTELEFDPFANVGEQDIPQAATPPMNSTPFNAPPAEQIPQGQGAVLARPRPGAGGQISMALPPPPTKQSIKAANQSKAAPPPVVTSPVSPPAPPASGSKLRREIRQLT